MANHSAGIVLYRPTDTTARSGSMARSGTTGATDVEIMLVHPGGPFWANKDEHGWSIPKGEFDPDTEDGRAAAWREFEEELGRPVPVPVDGREAVGLGPFRAGRKTISAWLVRADFDPSNIISNTVQIEWPPRSGRRQVVPEVDRASWFTLDEARSKLHKGQVGLVDLIVEAISHDRRHVRSVDNGT